MVRVLQMDNLVRGLSMMGWGTAMLLSAAFIGTGAVAQGLADASTPPAVIPAAASAQEQEQFRQKRDEQLLIALDSTYQQKRVLGETGPRPQEVGSLVFTMWEHMLIEEWRNTDNINTRAPDAGEQVAAPGGIREIALSGIVWRSNTDWTVWLNGQRLKPDALPREVMDINVRKRYVELKWYDASTNLIYPVRLRPHQRFNLDSRMFLPGTAAN